MQKWQINMETRWRWRERCQKRNHKIFLTVVSWTFFFLGSWLLLFHFFSVFPFFFFIFLVPFYTNAHTTRHTFTFTWVFIPTRICVYIIQTHTARQRPEKQTANSLDDWLLALAPKLEPEFESHSCELPTLFSSRDALKKYWEQLRHRKFYKIHKSFRLHHLLISSRVYFQKLSGSKDQTNILGLK